MPSLKTQFSVGLFVIFGVLTGIFIIIWLGLSDYLEKGHYFVAFFDESVQGLEKDSPVKYRGVSIGSVADVGVAPDQNLIEVLMKIESGIEPEKNLDSLVAQLKSVGITGLMFIELERKRAGDPNFNPDITFATEFPVIATRPSEISQIIKGIDDVISIVKELDFKGISTNLIVALKNVSEGVEDADIKKISVNASKTLEFVQGFFAQESFQQLPGSFTQTSERISSLAETGEGAVTDLTQTIAHLNTLMKTNSTEINETIRTIKSAAQSMQNVLKETTILVSQSGNSVDAMQLQFNQTLTHLHQTLNQFNTLLEEIKDQPALLFFGEPPPDKRIR